MPDRIFGDIEGVKVGKMYDDRKELAKAKVHRPRQAGISGSGYEGADSIVVSGGYEDDQDLGDVIIYTGHGGHDPATGKQIEDQKFTVGNLALDRSRVEGLPVRVVRGAGGDPKFSPEKGYRYDGLYYVADTWKERGKSGFIVYRFRLERDDASIAPWMPAPTTPTPPGPPGRRKSTVQRIVRNTQRAQRVKSLHGYRCQVCGIRLETPAGLYAEGAHIQPLGAPHNGPDTEENILCLCPNHHVLFDQGAFTVGDGGELIGAEGDLSTTSGHEPSGELIAYHREHIYRAD
jgi:putative restriction endonuclease